MRFALAARRARTHTPKRDGENGMNDATSLPPEPESGVLHASRRGVVASRGGEEEPSKDSRDWPWGESNLGTCHVCDTGSCYDRRGGFSEGGGFSRGGGTSARRLRTRRQRTKFFGKRERTGFSLLD